MKKHHALPSCERDRLETHLHRFLMDQENVLFAFLHGSFLDHDLPFGDIDVAVFFRHNPKDPVRAILDLKETLESGINFAYEIDVQMLNGASLGFRFHASRGTVLACKDQEALDTFRQETWLRYWDCEPFLRQSLTYLLEP
ncbi:MAG: nucleotidyltransferase domain-containing protein [Limnochordia bacterium]|jgi:predicted nucleotidyltransferase